MYSPEKFIAEWIGVPHVYNGRDKRGVDCYGLVWLYYRDVLGLMMPDWYCADSSKLWVMRFMDKEVRDRLVVIDKPEDNCIAVIKRNSISNHIGVIYGDGFFHCLENTSVVYQPIRMAEMLYGNLIYGRPSMETVA